MTTLRNISTAQAASIHDDGLLLKVEDLKISIPKGSAHWLPIVDRVNLSLKPNESVGIVGESGSGKTMLCRALLGTLARHGAVITSGKLLFEGLDLATASPGTWRQVRGRRIGYVPQSSLAGLNPVLTVGTQLIESLLAFRPMDRHEAIREAVELLERVRIPRAKQILDHRAHQLSGGMRQRVMIAAAIAQRPKLLVADEPTTALDVTVQREILTLISSLQKDLGMTLILVSHDLAVIEEVCERMMVMYAGASVETGPVDALTQVPRHPYTRSLHASQVSMAAPGKDIETIPGEPVSVGAWPQGCRFAPRCPMADDACRQGSQPPLMPVMPVGLQLSACIHADRMDGGA